MFLDVLTGLGRPGIRNFQGNVWDKARDIGGEAFERDFSTGRRACFGCSIGCTHTYRVESGEFAGTYGEGPEFGMTQLGLRCGIDNLPSLLKMNQLFNEYGLDPVSTQQIVAWVMDCYTRGILTEEDLDGMSPTWGDYTSTIAMIHKISMREGIGDILAEGEKRIPQLMKDGTEKYMYHVKGMAPVIEDPRAGKLFGLGYYTATRGGDHLRGLALSMKTYLSDTGQPVRRKATDPRTPVGKGGGLKWWEDFCAVNDCLGLCKFIYPLCGVSIQQMAKLVVSATGVDFTREELFKIGERIYNVEKAFNSRQGLTRKDDQFSVPEKFTQEPVKDGPYEGCVVELDFMLDDYYEARGWDKKTGLQTRQKLEELGLEHIANELVKTNAIIT